jgi:adenylate kinase
MQGGYYPGLPEEAIKKIKPDAIVLAEYNPEDIIERRKKDMMLKEKVEYKEGIISMPRAGREIESYEEIELHQEINRAFATAVSFSVQVVAKLLLCNL